MTTILTEANRRVATGHFMEAIELASVLMEEGEDVKILVNNDCPSALMGRIPCQFTKYEYRNDNEISAVEIGSILVNVVSDVLVTDLREVSNNFIKEIRNYFKGKIICIDEWGRRCLDADVIINPMVDPYYWSYPASKAQIYAGAEYLILPRKLQEYRGKYEVREDIRRICVSMGGVDAKGTTLKLAKWLPEIISGIELELILGAGFEYKDELNRIVSENEDRIGYMISENVNDIYEHFIKADIVFCAGGNTLHELACLGIPTIVIPTMPHEERNGHCFEKIGFGKCLSSAISVDKNEIRNSMNILTSKTIRHDMNRHGSDNFRGDGAEKIEGIVMSLLLEKF